MDQILSENVRKLGAQLKSQSSKMTDEQFNEALQQLFAKQREQFVRKGEYEVYEQNPWTPQVLRKAKDPLSIIVKSRKFYGLTEKQERLHKDFRRLNDDILLVKSVMGSFPKESDLWGDLQMLAR